MPDPLETRGTPIDDSPSRRSLIVYVAVLLAMAVALVVVATFAGEAGTASPRPSVAPVPQGETAAAARSGGGAPAQKEGQVFQSALDPRSVATPAETPNERARAREVRMRAVGEQLDAGVTPLADRCIFESPLFPLPHGEVLFHLGVDEGRLVDVDLDDSLASEFPRDLVDCLEDAVWAGAPPELGKTHHIRYSLRLGPSVPL